MDGQGPKKKVFSRSMTIDHDVAIQLLKRAGFMPTEDPDTFTRMENRSTHEKDGGARYITTVKLSDLLSDPKRWRSFCKRYAPKKAQ